MPENSLPELESRYKRAFLFEQWKEAIELKEELKSTAGSNLNEIMLSAKELFDQCQNIKRDVIKHVKSGATPGGIWARPLIQKAEKMIGSLAAEYVSFVFDKETKKRERKLQGELDNSTESSTPPPELLPAVMKSKDVLSKPANASGLLKQSVLATTGTVAHPWGAMPRDLSKIKAAKAGIKPNNVSASVRNKQPLSRNPAKKQANLCLINSIKANYQKALLDGNNDSIKMQEKKLLGLNLPDIDDYLAKTIQWLERCREMEKQVNRIAENGESRNSPDFNNLKKKARDLGKNAVSYLEGRFDYFSALFTLTTSAINPNSIPELKPAKKWSILFDESGTFFSKKMIVDSSRPISEESKGRMIALLVPDYSNLEECEKGFHCVEQPASAVIEMIRRVCNSECGVIGIPIESLPAINADQWLASIEILFELILRLLQVDGDTNLEILVEQRYEFDPDKSFYLQKMCDTCVNHLSVAFPEKAGLIHFEPKPRIISKDDSLYNGYADVIAHAWGSPKRDELLPKTGWKDTCFFATSPIFITSCLDIIAREHSLSPEDWNKMLDMQNPNESNSLVKSQLINIGKKALVTPELWIKYMQFANSCLDAKLTDLDALSLRVSWLKEYQPEKTQLPPRMRLLWLTIKLAEDNHWGIVDSHLEIRKEFKELTEQLYADDARLVCYALLHLAVSYTNEFDFIAARNLLLPWRDEKIAIPGRQYYGQILSSLGQHEAFLGNSDAAIAYFKKAIENFEQLSDGDIHDDASKTRCYYVTALMDLLPDSRKDFLEEMEKYLKNTIPDAATRLSVSTDDPYRHHILLRYLASHPEETKARISYMVCALEWKYELYHPWEMIEFYRAVLCDKPEEIISHLRNAYAIAMEGGETLKVIAAVILGSLLLYENSVAAEYDTLAKKVVEMVPKLGTRGDFLLKQQNDRLSPLELAKAVLPFNFR